MKVRIEVDKTIFDFLRTAFESLYEIEKKLNELYEKLAENCTESMLNKIADYQEKAILMEL